MQVLFISSQEPSAAVLLFTLIGGFFFIHGEIDTFGWRNAVSVNDKTVADLKDVTHACNMFDEDNLGIVAGGYVGKVKDSHHIWTSPGTPYRFVAKSEPRPGGLLSRQEGFWTKDIGVRDLLGAQESSDSYQSTCDILTRFVS